MSRNFTQGIQVSRKPVWVALLLLLVLVALMIVSFSYSYRQSSADKNRIDLVSDLTLLSQQLLTSTLGVRSDTGVFVGLLKQQNEFESKFRQLQNEQEGTGFALTKDNLDGIRVTWEPFTQRLSEILEYRDAIQLTHDYAETVYTTLPELQIAAEQVVLRLEQNQSNVDQLNIAISELIILQKLQNSLLLMLEGRNAVENVIKDFSKNTLKFDDKLNLLLKGNAEKNIKPVTNPEARFYLEEIAKKFGGLSVQIGALLDNATLLQRVYASVSSSEKLGKDLFESTALLKKTIGERGDSLRHISFAGYFFAFLGFASLFWLAYALLHDQRERLRITTEENRRNQEGIMHLMNRMTALSQGDLTVSARVTDDITGSISDAFNFTVEALRDLVARINTTSTSLNNYAIRADKTAGDLSQASRAQSEEVVSASSAITAIAENVERVSNYAANSAHVAQKSLQISREGANTVRETLAGMNAIREQVQVTAKRIKRLSESSQEVSHISQLMNDIAEQTQVLALNASIQMSSAGDAGKGFGGVAEEVQLLAKKAVATSRKAEVLVKTMQTDTQKTVTSMEETITHVVQGTKTAETAGKALGEVETESARIANLMVNIAKITREQLQLANRTKHRMDSIQQITVQAFERVGETTDLINNLTSTANEMQVSVYRFKLPEQLQSGKVVDKEKDEFRKLGAVVNASEVSEPDVPLSRRMSQAEDVS